MLEKQLKSKDIVSPDVLYIPEGNISLRCFSKTAYTCTTSLDKTYVTEGNYKHPSLVQDADFLDFRVGKDNRIISFWTNTTNVLKKLKVGIENLNNNTFISFKTHVIFDNIYEYDIVFVRNESNKNIVIKCNYSDLDSLINNTLLTDNLKYRFYHIISPSKKKKLIETDEELRNDKKLYYNESCRMGTSRIGDIDVALYHLLKFEE